MDQFPIYISPSGAILLGPDISCDGFYREYKVRVQTHIHVDHMNNFERSKGLQDIYLTKATKELLIAELNADLPYRQNIKVIKIGSTLTIGSSKVTILSSSHMLGAVQVAVELDSGLRLGYSGDFQWPVDEIIKVDALVLDSTYGSPRSLRKYSQGMAEQKLLEKVNYNIIRGPIYIKAYRGTLQRALNVLSGDINCSLVASPRLCKEIQIYRNFGYGIGTVLSTDSEDAREVMNGNHYIRFFGKGDKLPVDSEAATTITLSAYMSRPDNPIVEYSENSLSISMSDHADFNGTLEYVKATGAKYVLTDNFRGGHGVELAISLSERLGIKAKPSHFEPNREWGA